jgi:hypothetical protein
VIRLYPGHGYVLSGMREDLWASPHQTFGRPPELAGIYLGHLTGTRIWHLFEIRIANKDEGVILMSTADLEQLTIRPL